MAGGKNIVKLSTELRDIYLFPVLINPRTVRRTLPQAGRFGEAMGVELPIRSKKA